MITIADIHTPAFAGHETFTLRYGWLSKGVQMVEQHPDLFSRDDALVLLGVGKNMVRAIRYWGFGSGVLEDVESKRGQKTITQPSSFGQLLLGRNGYDPYLEDSGSLWLIHWNLTSRPEGPTTWYWAFNELQEPEFTREKLRSLLHQFIERASWKRVAESSINRDVDCFLRSYVSGTGKEKLLEETLESPLTELGLIYEVDTAGTFAFNRGEHPSLENAIFCYCLLDYWGKVALHKNTLTFDQLAYQARSPGRVFKLSENALTEHLEMLVETTEGAITFDNTAGLRQVYRKRELNFDATSKRILRKHYRGGK
jgi:Protein of unknown function (DUF4007)